MLMFTSRINHLESVALVLPPVGRGVRASGNLVRSVGVPVAPNAVRPQDFVFSLIRTPNASGVILHDFCALEA